MRKPCRRGDLQGGALPVPAVATGADVVPIVRGAIAASVVPVKPSAAPASPRGTPPNRCAALPLSHPLAQPLHPRNFFVRLPLAPPGVGPVRLCPLSIPLVPLSDPV